MTELPYLLPFDALSAEERSDVGAGLKSWPENLRTLAIGFETAEFIRNTATMYSLTEAQHRGIARFVMEAVLKGGVPTSQMGPELSRIAGVDANTAVQILKELESGLLSPLGLTFSGLTAPAKEPELVVSEEGTEGLKYSSADDLLADIADLSPTERDRFLADAKGDNRIIVLQTLSQLKLGADTSGRPLSFRQLVATEANDFSVGDWSDLARTDPDALAEPGVLAHIARTPLGAMLAGRDPASARDIVLQFGALDDDSRKIAVDPESSDAIEELVRSGLVPQTHRGAIGRVVFFLLTGQASPGEVTGLLLKLGLSEEASLAAARVVSALTAAVPPPPEPDPVTPARQQAAPRTPGLNVPNVSGRTILDLRLPVRQAGKPQP